MARPQIADDVRRALSRGESPLRLPSEGRPGIGPRQSGNPGRVPETSHVGVERGAPAPGQTSGGAPHVRKTHGQVASGSGTQELGIPVRRTQPDADAMGKIQPPPLADSPPSADRTGRQLPEGLPLVEGLDPHALILPPLPVTNQHQPVPDVWRARAVRVNWPSLRPSGSKRAEPRWSVERRTPR
jgi:hypothetical protein